MSGKTEKKLRQLYRRDFHSAAIQQAERQVSMFPQFIKPKPKWMPAFVYQWCFKVVIK